MKTILRNFTMLSLVAGSLLLFSCRETAENESAPPMQNQMREGERMNSDTTATAYNDQTTAEFSDPQVAAMYEHYISIKQALVQTDASMAQDNAKGMISKLESNEENSQVATAARNIASTSNVNEQREAFSDLTKAMEVKLENAISSGEIYKQYCPMAFDGKGDSWFSNSPEIRNPYYGDKMLKCGRIEATLN